MLNRFSALALLCIAASALTPSLSHALPEGFSKQRLLPNYGIKRATSVNVASDGRIFVTEGSGTLLIFNDENDSNPGRNINRGSRNWWDYIWSATLDPDFPEKPFIYVLLTDRIGQDGTHVVYKLTVDGKTIIDWGQGGTEIWRGGCVGNDRGHHGADLEFGPDSKLYFTVGEGSTDTFIDQDEQGCGQDPSAHGGSWRSQDAYHLNYQHEQDGGPPADRNNWFARQDATRPNGSLLRINADGSIPADNPWSVHNTDNFVETNAIDDDAIIAYGLRNPFKLAVSPFTNKIYIGDVGDHRSEEINLVADPTDTLVENFGWPCYEGWWQHTGYKSRNTALCNHFYSVSNYHAGPWYDYLHPGWDDVSNPTDQVELASVTALEIYPGGGFPDKGFPDEYDGALFFGDHEQDYIKVIMPDANREPNKNEIAHFEPTNKIVDLHADVDGDLYFVEYDDNNSKIFKVSYTGNGPIEADLVANQTAGNAGLMVHFDGSGSISAAGYAWDLDNDGQFDDGTSAKASHTFDELGAHPVTLKVHDVDGNESIANTLIFIHDETLPIATITSPPASSFRWHALEPFTVSGAATDENGNPVSAVALSWESGIFHCQFDDPSDCHVHPMRSDSGTNTFTVTPTEHDMPSRVNVTLRARSRETWAFEWWNDDWEYRRAVFFDNRGAGDKSNFPAYIELDASRINYGEAGSGGLSLRFVGADNRPLTFDIERWDPNGESIVWVEAPSVPAGSYSSYIWMYYGNDAAGNGEAFVQLGERNASFSLVDNESSRQFLYGLTTLEYEPETARLLLDTNRDGLSIVVNGTTYPAPYDAPVIINNPMFVEVSDPQSVNNTVYGFLDWSDGETHPIHTEFHMPTLAMSLTANFDEGKTCDTEYDQMFLNGSFNGWEAWNAIELKLDGTCSWFALIAATSNDSLKFRPSTSSWDINFGDDNNDGFADGGNADNIVVPFDGVSKVWFNDRSKQYGFVASCESAYPAMFISGTNNDWGADAMTFDETDCVWIGSATFDGSGDSEGPDRFKFRPSAISWGVSFGDGNGDGLAVQDVHPNDTAVPASGPYSIRFNDNTFWYDLAFEGCCIGNFDNIYLAGTHNGWVPDDASTELSLVDNHVWEIELALTAGEEFKFTTGTWELSFGDVNADGTAEKSGGGNIVVPAPSSDFVVRFNDETLDYSVAPKGDEGFEKNYSHVFLAGTHNGWDPANSDWVLSLVDHHTWRLAADLIAGDQVKFTTGSWAVSFGDADGTADTGNFGNIHVPAPGGSVIILFNDETLAYSITENQ